MNSLESIQLKVEERLNSGSFIVDFLNCLNTPRERSTCCTYKDGSELWFYNGTLHRDFGPATTYSQGLKQREWYRNGRLHRLDGPAVEYRDGKGQYWIDGFEYTEADWQYRDQEKNEFSQL